MVLLPTLGRPTIPQFKDIQYILLKLLVQMAGEIPSARWAGGFLAWRVGKAGGNPAPNPVRRNHFAVFLENGTLLLCPKPGLGGVIGQVGRPEQSIGPGWGSGRPSGAAMARWKRNPRVALRSTLGYFPVFPPGRLRWIGGNTAADRRKDRGGSPEKIQW